jgi:hypothetical protein
MCVWGGGGERGEVVYKKISFLPLLEKYIHQLPLEIDRSESQITNVMSYRCQHADVWRRQGRGRPADGGGFLGTLKHSGIFAIANVYKQVPPKI